MRTVPSSRTTSPQSISGFTTGSQWPKLAEQIGPPAELYDHPSNRFVADDRATERMFQTAGRSYESVVSVLNDDGSKILTRYETRNDPPNYYVRDLKTNERRALTNGESPVVARVTDPARGTRCIGELPLASEILHRTARRVIVYVRIREPNAAAARRKNSLSSWPA